ncbi:bud neck involved protein [Rhizina undulata]
MAALVQTLPPQQSSTSVTLMQPRPQTASGSLQAASQGSSGHHAQHHLTTPRNMTGYTNPPSSGNSTSGGYRAGYTTAPVAPYAFTSTPGLSNSKQQILSPPKIGERTSSAPAGGLGRPEDLRNRYPAPDSVSSSSSASSDPSLRYQQSQPHSSTSRQKEDVSSPGKGRANIRPLSTVSVPNLAPPAVASPTRPSPDRYRRGNRASSSNMSTPGGSALPSGSGMAAVAAIYSQPHKASSNPSLPPNGMSGIGSGSVTAPFIAEYTGQLRSQSVDDIHTYHQPSYATPQQSRRRSIGPGSFTAESFQNFVRQELAASTAHATPLQLITRPESPASGSSRSQKSEGKQVASNTTFQPPVRPGSRRNGSTDSSASGNSSNPSSHHNSLTSNSANAANQTPSTSSNSSPHEISLAHVPPRGSSTDGTKRTTAPSPLSKPVAMTTTPPATQSLPTGQIPSGNVQEDVKKSLSNADKIAALSSDLPRKGMKNRLRRAFSFGSAAELRKASAANSMRGEEAAERARLRQERYREEQEAEQARIAKIQEEGGIGEGIYNGQGNFFTGSTDNISVSSTASSASVMIRKMGKGMKRSTRSLVGLFRPKSVHGESSSSAQVAPQPSVSMVTVEAVNASVDPREQPAGSTGFPKLDKNSVEGMSKAGDALTASMRRGSIGNDNKSARRSIAGGEKERQEVLNAVKKGILKRTGSSSPVAKPVDSAPQLDFQLPPIPPMSPTLADNQRPRADSLKIEREDYFQSGSKFQASTSSNSAPPSPNSANKYNVSFSPRITFHETWPSGEYDRRGEIATCNRLTPMLAQQIKEELNTFKMVL